VHFREILRFKNAGDPLTMLRSVNPREAALVDAASGTTNFVETLVGERRSLCFDLPLARHSRPIQVRRCNVSSQHILQVVHQRDRV
jgi:hypothetical protein